jgi:hypothetical protein
MRENAENQAHFVTSEKLYRSGQVFRGFYKMDDKHFPLVLILALCVEMPRVGSFLYTMDCFDTKYLQAPIWLE